MRWGRKATDPREGWDSRVARETTGVPAFLVFRGIHRTKEKKQLSTNIML